MSRLLPAGGLVLSQADARVLYQVASIGKLRTHYRMGDTTVYALLTEITRCAYTAVDADDGKLARQSAASEERGWWTVRQVATAAGRSPRTVRLDCERGALPATKSGPQWVIQREDAETYVTAYR